MDQRARKIARALLKEYGHERHFEVSFQEAELLSLVAETLRKDFGCAVIEDKFKPRLQVEVPNR